LQRHTEAVSILKEQFGDEITEGRLKMVDFPRGSALIPNPVNRVPGFSIRNGFFLPGFPSMATPMMRWVLEVHVPKGVGRVRRTVVLRSAREGDLVEFMDQFVADHPTVTFSSLPQLTETGPRVVLSNVGPEKDVEAAHEALQVYLRAMGIEFEETR